MPRKTTPVIWELVIEVDDRETMRHSFIDVSKAKQTFLAVVNNADSGSASVFAYDASGRTLARVWHYESNA